MQNAKEDAITTDDHDINLDFSFSYLHGWLNKTPQFMMYVYKIKPCKRTICSFSSSPCPFLHDGEVGRRDLLWHKYSFIPCVDFKSGFCPRGITCDCTHGILEQRFHPMLFRTRYCWYMTTCKRKDCSYAHKEEEIRVPTIAPYVTCPRSSQPYLGVLSDIFSNISNALDATDFPTSHSLWNNRIPDCSSKFETTSRLFLEPRMKANTIKHQWGSEWRKAILFIDET